MIKNRIVFYFLGLATPIVAAMFFLFSGAMPVATKGPPLPFESYIAHIALHAAMGNQDKVQSPVEMNETNLLAGAKVYKINCAVCHGLPNRTPSSIAQGLFPKPPRLFEKDEEVTDDSVGKIYWKVKNGIRLTGMPGFESLLDEREIWQVSQLLMNADKLSEGVKSSLQEK